MSNYKVDNSVIKKNIHALVILGLHDKAIKTCIKAIKHEPNNPFYLKQLGAIYRGIGDDEVALYYFEQAVRLDHLDFGSMSQAIQLN